MQENHTTHWVSKRTLRVFVSSTFHDLHDERDELIKGLFREIIFCQAQNHIHESSAL